MTDEGRVERVTINERLLKRPLIAVIAWNKSQPGSERTNDDGDDHVAAIFWLDERRDDDTRPLLSSEKPASLYPLANTRYDNLFTETAR